jgi:biotin carboxylase
MARVVLLVPSSSYRVADFLDAARRLGAEVAVAGDEPHALAPLAPGRTLVVDLDDPAAAADALVAYDAEFPLDAVVAVDDRGALAAAEAAARLGLAHNPPGALAAARDKALMRTRLEAAEVPQPPFVELPAHASPDELVRLVSKVGFPAVVKPTTLSASQGVLRVDEAAAVEQTVSRVRAIASAAGVPPQAPLLAERFVAGPEVALEGLLTGGRLEVLALFDKPDPLEGPAFEETIYVTPSRLDGAGQQAAAAVVQGAARALGLVQGPVHAELRVSGGRATLIELAARTIGGLCARSLVFGTGHSLEELVLAQALGVALPERRRRDEAAGVLMIPIPGAGVLRAVDGRAAALSVPGVAAVELTVVPGRHVAPPPEGDRYLGFVFARAAHPEAVERALRAAGARLEVRLEPV